ncbi:transcription termination/antitermination protein NusA [Listeria monocytogenes]|uniref:transcription termination factor NusA n=1 Tax=Listeria monocytogenes TaxID=1639 RepID=UPI000E74D826|nr:transcription termination factor NusA [Listeria monocytogenes]EAC3179149.1 transcription termination/antitermination protein NusA [Listeria monocytogenes]EAC6731380.1 transcription termination/antitermination protein NusA [Listeria monocytogenes]EAC7056029.1 transcription termination/antitermination protein NusA [Listeria monocytogenes]EAC8346883.1 transcription termination/antitermination protein NusA [Listeria monocytogenes]EAD1513495.1 transcription termination/antitermination protein Nu
MSTELLDALHVLEHDKGISREVLVEAIEAALTSAYKRNFKDAQNVRVDLNMENGSIRVLARKEAVEQVFDSRLEISMEEAHKLNPVYKPGDVVELEVTPRDFGRIAAQTAKQVVTQRVREAERGIIYDEFIDREDDIMTGIVERQDSRFIYVNLGKIEAILSQNEQMPNETYHAHDRIKVYLTKVEKTTKGPQIFVSRTHPGLLKRLFEMEVPEIYDGVVEIKSVAREAGDRSKISVYTANEEVDPVGACVGPKGARVQTIVNELKGEKIDIVEWSEDPFTFVANALSPSKVLDVIVNEADQATTVIVPDYQLSLAIGKRGQNARLAAKLTGWKIDIKSETVATELGIYPRNDVEAPEVEDAESETYTEDEE